MVYNSYFKRFVLADVSVSGGKFLCIGPRGFGAVKADETVDAESPHMVSGLTDIHMCIEDSILTPGTFCRWLAERGITTTVPEPHEMANVNGVQGVPDVIGTGENNLVDVFYGVPSYVSSTSPELEAIGGVITCEEMGGLKENPWAACVGEVISYRAIIRGNQLKVTRSLKQLREKDRIFPTKDHYPALLDLDSAKFLYLDNSRNHTEYSLEELEQRFANGMFMEIQEKMLRRGVLDYIREHELERHFCFVADGVMADTLCIRGHLDALVRKAMELGMLVGQATYNASFTSTRRMDFLGQGAVALGKVTDSLLLSGLDTFAVSATYKGGKCIWCRGQDEGEQPAQGQHDSDRGQNMHFSEPYYHSIHLEFQEQSRFEVPMGSNSDTIMVRVMEIQDGSTKTKEIIMGMPVRDGFPKWEGTGCLLAAVSERYGKGQAVGYRSTIGNCHKWGAVATSYIRDCHNILMAGANPADMKLALNRVIEMQGDMATADGGGTQAELLLHAGGILSNRPAKEVGVSFTRVRETMTDLGYRHYSPIMLFRTLTLPASPTLELMDKGLIDVEACKIVPLEVGGQGAQP